MSRNESETRADLIDPALVAAGWGIVEGSRILRESRARITNGRLIGAGRREKAEIADYILVYRNRKLAVIEAKHEGLDVSEGVAQAKTYAEKLSVRFAYAANGHKIYRMDLQSATEGDVSAFPTPDQLWQATFAKDNLWRNRFAAVPFEDRSGSREVRYYQDTAIQRVLDAIAANQQRILLTLATGTGKTEIAFQIAWKLFNAKWNLSREPSRRPRILFLADRNILADQAYNAFSAFADDARKRITPASVINGQVPTNASVFFTIFQTFMTGTDEDGNSTPFFGKYPPDFFDFIVIDECHRGGANDEGNWRGIMDYFSPAVQLGLTATPKRKDNVDTYKYFGEPVYIYSLKEGINDGFLTPFKVRQVSTTIDDYVYTPDDIIVEGDVEAGRRYTESDFNRIIEIEQREQYRVKLLMEMLGEAGQREKALVFCHTQAHAAATRNLINQYKSPTITESSYCVRVTANDGAIGDQYLRDFQNNDNTIPTILTTSQKLSTGVDARNIRNIVLFRPIKSMIEFKQIIGRGTRLYDGKDFFTIFDFVKAHHHFNDPEWDGEPIDPEPKPDKPSAYPPIALPDLPGDPDDAPPPKQRLVIKLADGKEHHLDFMSATSFWSADGRPMSAAQFIGDLFGAVPDFFKDEDQLRKIWSIPETRKALLLGLEEKGFTPEIMSAIQRAVDAENSDLYDVLAYVAFQVPPLARTIRADSARHKIHHTITEKQEAFLDFVLSHYIQEGVGELDQEKLSPLVKLKYGNSMPDALDDLGSAETIKNLFINFQQHLYDPSIKTVVQ